MLTEQVKCKMHQSHHITFFKGIIDPSTLSGFKVHPASNTVCHIHLQLMFNQTGVSDGLAHWVEQVIHVLWG